MTEGFTGEWIVRVKGITGPEDVERTGEQIIRCLNVTGLRHAEVVFDASRWKGGDFE